MSSTPSETTEDISTMLTHINPWLVFFCSIAILIIFVLCLVFCFYLAFRPSRRRSKKGLDPNPNGENSRTGSSLDHKRVLSSRSFNGSSGHQNMVPLESGIIRSGNYCNYPTMQGRNSGVTENQSNVGEKRWYGASDHCFSFKEIIEITRNFDRKNLIGVGSYAKVYRGVFFDGTQVAIKELLLSSVQGEELRLIMEEFPNITHKNIVKIIGFCVKECHPYARTRYIFVSEYVDNGNLHQWLHNQGDIVSSLTWRIRMEIISGIAKGLAYVHEDVEVNMVHGRLQSCKILLDQNWNPKISDFGAGSLEQGHYTEEGYMAPESATTEESDVYSFGILIMEIISGRKPVDHSRPKEEIKLVEWLRSKILEQEYDEIADPKIEEAPPSKELKRMLLIALRCADFDPGNRPKMGQVIHMLQPLDLLLSDAKKIVRRSDRSRDQSEGFSENYSDYRNSDSDSRDDSSRHSNYDKQLVIMDIV